MLKNGGHWTKESFFILVLLMTISLFGLGESVFAQESGVNRVGAQVQTRAAAPTPGQDIVDSARQADVPLGTRLMGLIGILVILGVVYLLSNHRRGIKLRIIAWGFGMQLILALFIIRTTPGSWVFMKLGDFIKTLLAFSDQGAQFVFGPLANAPPLPTDYPGIGVIFAFRVLPTIIFISSLFSVLYYFGIMQRVVLLMAKFMTWTMHVSGAESLAAAANVFMGQTEAPLVIAPYIEKMTRSELLCLMLGGMATVSGGVMAAYIGMGIEPVYLLAGSVMAAPAAVMVAKILIPEQEEPLTAGVVKIDVKVQDRNVIDAAANGASGGAKLAINVAAILIAFLALIAMINALFGVVHARLDFFPQSMEMFLGWIFSPLAFVMGVPLTDVQMVGNLFGQKLIATEFVAYAGLASIQSHLHPRSVLIATYALCGFANFGSVGIQIGGIGGIAPSRRHDLATLGLKAMLGGFLATCLTGTIAGLIS